MPDLSFTQLLWRLRERVRLSAPEADLLGRLACLCEQQHGPPAPGRLQCVASTAALCQTLALTDRSLRRLRAALIEKQVLRFTPGARGPEGDYELLLAGELLPAQLPPSQPAPPPLPRASSARLPAFPLDELRQPLAGPEDAPAGPAPSPARKPGRKPAGVEYAQACQAASAEQLQHLRIFEAWCQEHAPRVLLIAQQLTPAQLEAYLQQHSVQMLANVCRGLHNYHKTASYQSAYLTLLRWSSSERDRRQGAAVDPLGSVPALSIARPPAAQKDNSPLTGTGYDQVLAQQQQRNQRFHKE